VCFSSYGFKSQNIQENSCHNRGKNIHPGLYLFINTNTQDIKIGNGEKIRQLASTSVLSNPNYFELEISNFEHFRAQVPFTKTELQTISNPSIDHNSTFLDEKAEFGTKTKSGKTQFQTIPILLLNSLVNRIGNQT